MHKPKADVEDALRQGKDSYFSQGLLIGPAGHVFLSGTSYLALGRGSSPTFGAAVFPALPCVPTLHLV